jgi:hypothetical protein
MKRPVIYLLAVIVGFYSIVTLVYNLNTHEKPLAVATSAVEPVCSVDPSELLGYINTERASLNAPVLIVDGQLTETANHKLNDMVAGKYYGHKYLDGSDSWPYIRAMGIHAALAEDLDTNAVSSKDDWEGLKNSPEHYKSLIDPQYTRVGIDEQCTDFVAEHSTGPDDNTNLIGTKLTELTVIHLAGVEPELESCSVTTCTDGSCSYSTGRGTCSWHGGVAY